MIIQIRNIEKKLFILCDCREGGLIFSKYETILEVNGKRKENPKIINLAQNKYESITLHTSSGRVCSNSVLFSFSFQTYIVLPLIRGQDKMSAFSFHSMFYIVNIIFHTCIPKMVVYFKLKRNYKVV